MNDWVNDILKEAGFLNKNNVEDIATIRARYEDHTPVSVKRSSILAALEHDKQIQDELLRINGVGMHAYTEGDYDLDGLYKLISSLFFVIETISQRKPSSSILLRKMLEDVSNSNGN